MPLHWFLFGLACAAALPAAFTLDPCLDTDTWWHMATGRWIVEQQQIPWVDPLAWHQQPTRWYAYSWLYGVVLYELFDKASYSGIIIARTIIVAVSTLSVMLYLVRSSGPTLQTIIVALLTGTVLMMFAKERPWHFTIAFTTLTLWAVQSIRETGRIRRKLWLLPLFALWANLHIQFVLGWLILGLACCFPGLANRKAVIALTLACVAATAINPYHVRLAEVIVEYATQLAPREYVIELASPAINSPSTWATIFLIAFGFWTIARQDKTDLFQGILLLISLLLAINQRRDIWVAALAAIATLRHGNLEVRNHAPLIIATVIGTFAATCALSFFGVGPSTDYPAASAKLCPIDAVRNSKANLETPVFSTFNWGGSLIWELDRPAVMMDGRTNLYGDERLRRHFQTWQASDGWQDNPAFKLARTVVAPPDQPLTAKLRSLPEVWQPVYEGEVAVIFVRLSE